MTSWYDASWTYRKSHVISGATDAGTNYQVKITVHYGSGSDSAGNVYTTSHCKTDFGDIRFTADDGTTLLSYWMGAKTNSDNAIFWVKVTADLGSDATIYVYYGNAGASTTSNGADTFINYDEFGAETAQADLWAVTYAGNVGHAGSYLDITVAATKNQTGGGRAGCLFVEELNAFNQGDIYVSGYSNAHYGSLTSKVAVILDYYFGDVWSANNGYWVDYVYIVFKYSDGSYRMVRLADYASGSEFRDNRIASGSSTFVYVPNDNATVIGGKSTTTWYNGEEYKSTTYDASHTVTDVYIGIGGGQDNNTGFGSCSGYMDNVKIRKYVSPEPANSTWGVEEQNIATTTITYSIDAMFQKLGVTKTDSIDVLFKKLLAGSPTYDVDVSLIIPPPINYYDIDINLKKFGITATDSIDTILKKLKLTKSDSADVLFKKLKIPLTTSIDVILQTNIPPTPVPDVPETLEISNPTNINDPLWVRPISWKESQECNPAIRPIPLAKSEYLDSDTWILKPRTITIKIRLSDKEKDKLETIYDYPSTLPVAIINHYLDFYLFYDTSKYTWHYLVWIREKSYKFEYALQHNRYVRWWIVELICDVVNFSGTSSTLPTWNSQTGYTTYLEDSNWTNLYNVPYYDPIAKAVRISDQRLDHILDFSRDDQHPAMIPNWINQVAEVDSYIWNECVLDTSYRCRMTNAEKYHMDLLLQGHQKINYEDYIHNIFSPKLNQSGGAWISSVEAEWDPTNWEKPWVVTISLQANNSETEERTAVVTVVSSGNRGTMYIDEDDALTLPDVETRKIGVHIFYFFQPANTVWVHWTVSGSAFILDKKGDTPNGIGGEHILTVLIYGNCTIGAIFNGLCDVTFSSIYSSGGGEHIINGGFESGTDGWTGPVFPDDSQAHSGSYSCFMYKTWWYNTTDFSVPTDSVTKFGYWIMMGDQFGGIDVIIYYTDGTNTNVGYNCGDQFDMCPTWMEWVYVDLKPYLVPDKIIRQIKFISVDTFYYIDDVTLISTAEDVHNKGVIVIDSGIEHDLPFDEDFLTSISHTLEYIPDGEGVFVSWEASSNITISDIYANPTTFTIDSDVTGWITAHFMEREMLGDPFFDLYETVTRFPIPYTKTTEVDTTRFPSHFVDVTDVPETFYEYEYNDLLDEYMEVYGNNWRAQTFTPSSTHYLRKVVLNLSVPLGGPTGDVVISIRNTDESGFPTGPDLTSVVFPASKLGMYGATFDIYFGTIIEVTSGTTYAIVVHATGGSSSHFVDLGVISTGGYSGGQKCDSSDGGSTWSGSGEDVTFQEWGWGEEE